MKTSTKQIIEIVGIFGVMASLLFVGMQLMLDRQVAESEVYQARAESRMANLRTMLESDSYMQRRGKLWEQGERPRWWNSSLEKLHSESGLSGADEWAEILQLQFSLEGYDSLYFQYQQGLLSDTYWAGARNALRRDLEDPMRRAFYLGTPRPVTTVVRELIQEIDTD